MIKKIRITGFKSIYDQTVELSPVTVLVGRSGTGKSAFVQAIRFLRNFVLNPEKATEAEGGWKALLSAGKRAVPLSFEVTFSTPAEVEDYCYLFRFPKEDPAEIRNSAPNFHAIYPEEKLSLGDDVLFHRLNQNPSYRGSPMWTWLVEPKVHAPPSPQLPNSISRLPSLEKVRSAQTALGYGIGFYNLPTNVWGLNTTSGKSFQPDDMDGLKDDASNHLKVMLRIAKDIHHPEIRKSINASLRAINPSVVSIELDDINYPQTGIVVHTAGDAVLDLSLAQSSDGFRRFYAHLLALYQTPAKLVNIFEEPENGIYPGALSLLAEEFKSAPDANRGQVILTTHSPILLSQFSVESIRVVTMVDGKTQIGPVAPDQVEAIREELLTTGELLTAVDPRNALPPESVEVTGE
jgi:predicted ATPase